MRRAGLLLCLLGGLAALGLLVHLRGGPREDAHSCVSGTITGRYGTIRLVHVVAQTPDGLLAETWTDTDGRYSLDVPPGVRFDLRARPMAATYLIPEERSLVLRPGERRDIAFDLKTIPLTKGSIVGAAFAPAISLSAIREDAREGSGTAARLSGFEFEFWGLDTGAPYRLEGWSIDWEIEGPVTFRGGDTGIVVRVRRIVSCALHVRECPRGDDIPAFTVKVLSPAGEAFATLEGKDGRLRWTAPHPDPASPVGARWTAVVSANGHFEERTRLTHDFVWLQPLREPNITLLVSDTDGTPYEGDLAAYGTARFGFGGTDARATKAGPGRYTAVLPPGRYWIRVERGPEYEPQRFDVTIGETDGVVVQVGAFVRRPPR